MRKNISTLLEVLQQLEAQNQTLAEGQASRCQKPACCEGEKSRCSDLALKPKPKTAYMAGVGIRVWGSAVEGQICLTGNTKAETLKDETPESYSAKP